jgi:XTP/dITP diphosphohydrolase
MMEKILVASTNPGKLVEIKDLLGDLGRRVELLLPAEIGLHLDVLEDGETYAENAALKARAYNQASGLLTLADDSGLEVAALDGKPGLHSARYSPKPNATDADRRAFLLKNLAGLPRPWKARFCCTVAIAAPDGSLHFSEGICPGEIIPEERGTNGFGYDPVFLLPKLGKSMAELSMSQKNRLSHRARAIHGAIPLLEKLLHSA